MVRLIRTSWLIRTVFCRFPSYELAEHPCILTKFTKPFRARMDKQNYHPYDQKFYTFAGPCPFEKLFQARIEHSTVTTLTNQREPPHLVRREPTQRL